MKYEYEMKRSFKMEIQLSYLSSINKHDNKDAKSQFKQYFIDRSPRVHIPRVNHFHDNYVLGNTHSMSKFLTCKASVRMIQ